MKQIRWMLTKILKYTNVPMHLIRGGLRPIGIAKGIQ